MHLTHECLTRIDIQISEIIPSRRIGTTACILGASCQLVLATPEVETPTRTTTSVLRASLPPALASTEVDTPQHHATKRTASTDKGDPRPNLRMPFRSLSSPPCAPLSLRNSLPRALESMQGALQGASKCGQSRDRTFRCQASGNMCAVIARNTLHASRSEMAGMQPAQSTGYRRRQRLQPT